MNSLPFATSPIEAAFHSPVLAEYTDTALPGEIPETSARAKEETSPSSRASHSLANLICFILYSLSCGRPDDLPQDRFSQVNQLQTGYENLTVGELANRAADGDAAAETAIKIIKQAAKKAAKY